ncbi:MAG TPA: hypothetical protein VK934_08910 [Fimbriimonas sp.]|nr:hypothetical protein [Fimbriimonas sp.]
MRKAKQFVRILRLYEGNVGQERAFDSEIPKDATLAGITKRDLAHKGQGTS